MFGCDELAQLRAIDSFGAALLLGRPGIEGGQVTPVGIQRVRRRAALHLQVPEEILDGVHAGSRRRGLRPGRSA